MFSTNKNRKIGMLIFLFVVSFIVGMLINIQRLGSLPMKLIQVEWNDTVGCVYENLDYENPSDHKYDLYVPKNLDTPESKCLILYIHGGSFNSGSKEDGDAWCKYYTSKGYVTATVDYTLQSKKEKSEEELLNASLELMNEEILICITKISTFLILCDLAVCLATLYVSFSLVFALMRYLQGKVFLIRFYSPTTLSSSRAEFRLPSRLACA